MSEQTIKIAVTSQGVPLFANTLTKTLKDAGYNVTFYKSDSRMTYFRIPFHSIDILWNVGFFFNIDCLFDSVKIRWPEVKIVNHWVGTDFLNYKGICKLRPKCRRCLIRSIDFHVADSEPLISELTQFGIEAEFVPTIPDPMPIRPLPQRFAVMVYAPPHRADFYRLPIIAEAAKSFPGVMFDLYYLDIIMPDGTRFQPRSAQHNIRFRGQVLRDAKINAWAQHNCCISLPVQSSGSLTAVEFLQMGRSAIVPFEMPFAYTIEDPVTPGKIVNALTEIMEIKQPNKEASEYYHREFGPEKLLSFVSNVLKKMEGM